MGWFENVYKSCYEDIYKFICKLCLNNGVTEDLTQDVFMVLYRKRHKLKDHECIKGWLYTTACNKTMDYLKRKKLKNKYDFELSAQTSIDTNILPYETYEMFSFFLTEDEIQILKLNALYGFTVKEIAASRAVEYSTFRQRVLRMKKKIMTALKNMMILVVVAIAKGVLK